MYGINDVFDYESDLRNPRKGGAHGAVLDRRMHPITLIAAAASCIPFIVYLLLVGGWPSWLVLAASMFFVVFYSAPPLRLKEVPFADSVTSSIHFFSPAVYGLVLAGAVWTPQLLAIIVAFALWGVASHAFGAVQDVAADREAGIASIATARGPAWTVWFALACYCAAGPRDARDRLAGAARGAARRALPARGVAVPARHRRHGVRGHAGLEAVPLDQPARRLRRHAAADLVLDADELGRGADSAVRTAIAHALMARRSVIAA